MHKFKYKIKNYKTAATFSLFVNIHSSSLNVRASLLTYANIAYSMTPKKVILTFWHQSYICNAHCDADDAKCQVLPTANYGSSLQFQSAADHTVHLILAPRENQRLNFNDM